MIEAAIEDAALCSLSLSEWLERIESRTARIGIIGLGYVGLPLTLLFGDERFRVTGFDIDVEKVKVAQPRRVIHSPDHSGPYPGGATSGF